MTFFFLTNFFFSNLLTGITFKTEFVKNIWLKLLSVLILILEIPRIATKKEIMNAELDKQCLFRSICSDMMQCCCGRRMRHPDYKDPEDCGGPIMKKILRSDEYFEVSAEDLRMLKERCKHD